jgi:hypothetical protein
MRRRMRQRRGGGRGRMRLRQRQNEKLEDLAEFFAYLIFYCLI